MDWYFLPYRCKDLTWIKDVHNHLKCNLVNFEIRLVVERVPEFLGTRPEPDFFWATRTRFFQVGYVPDPTRTRHYENPHKIWSKRCMIPDKIPDFLSTRIWLFGIPTLPDPTGIRLFTIQSIWYPTFCYPLYHYIRSKMDFCTMEMILGSYNWQNYISNGRIHALFK